MTTPIAYPYSGGQRHSAASAEIKIAGQIFLGWKSVDYSWKLEPQAVYGNHPDPIGETLGQAAYEGNLEVYLAEYQQLLNLLGKGFATTKFTITVSYSENGFDTITDTLVGCRMKGGDASAASGPDALTRKIPLYITKILPNGVDLLAVPLQGA